MLATMSDAHREWHRNTGVPMGQPGCPQDACHLPDDLEYDPKSGFVNPVKCGRCSRRNEPVYHEGPAGVRSCSLAGTTSVFGPADSEPLFTEVVVDAPVVSVPREVWEASIDSQVAAMKPPFSPPEVDWDAGTQAAPEPVYDGIYTVESPEGHRTLRVRTQDADSEFAPGKVVLSYLSGSDNENNYTGFAFLVDGEIRLWNRFRGQASLLRDAEALVSDPSGTLSASHCSRCHRTLTVPASIYNGMGPECAKKG